MEEITLKHLAAAILDRAVKDIKCESLWFSNKNDNAEKHKLDAIKFFESGYCKALCDSLNLSYEKTMNLVSEVKG